MKNLKSTTQQIASAKRQNIPVEKYISGLVALKASILRGKELVK